MKSDLEQLNIETVPPGVKVDLNKQTSCTSPCSLELERRVDYTLNMSKQGYANQSVAVDGHSWDPWLLGNVIFFFAAPIAIAVDFYTGYAYDLKPYNVDVTLKSISTEEIPLTPTQAPK